MVSWCCCGADGYPEDAIQLARKTVHLRIFDDADGVESVSSRSPGADVGHLSVYALCGLSQGTTVLVCGSGAP